MPLLQVRDFPDDLYQVLKDTAKRDNRSVAQETIVLLRGELGVMQSSNQKIKNAIAYIKEYQHEHPQLFSGYLDSEQLIREDRDR
ncbi:hypothetical protein FACS1894104_1210 [Actinomycetota bacterium]|nr:hypothetical protein FACS1894104_1210 [Actinomycetota bacterium]